MTEEEPLATDEETTAFLEQLVHLRLRPVSQRPNGDAWTAKWEEWMSLSSQPDLRCDSPTR